MPTYVERLQALAQEVTGFGLSDDEIVSLIFRTIGIVDLEDRDNLGPISEVVATHFSSEVLLQFLARVEQVVEAKRAGPNGGAGRAA